MNGNIWRILLWVCLHAMHGWETYSQGLYSEDPCTSSWAFSLTNDFKLLSLSYHKKKKNYHCSLTRCGCCNILFMSVAIFTCLLPERISTQTCNDRWTRNHTQFIRETNVLYGQNHTHRFSIKYANVVYKAKIRSKVPQKDEEKLMRTLLTQVNTGFSSDCYMLPGYYLLWDPQGRISWLYFLIFLWFCRPNVIVQPWRY